MSSRLYCLSFSCIHTTFLNIAAFHQMTEYMGRSSCTSQSLFCNGLVFYKAQRRQNTVSGKLFFATLSYNADIRGRSMERKFLNTPSGVSEHISNLGSVAVFGQGTVDQTVASICPHGPSLLRAISNPLFNGHAPCHPALLWHTELQTVVHM